MVEICPAYCGKGAQEISQVETEEEVAENWEGPSHLVGGTIPASTVKDQWCDKSREGVLHIVHDEFYLT